jgi:hypothetical protein
MRKVFIIHKRAIRILLWVSPKSSCRESFKNLDILRVPCLYIDALMLVAVKNLNICQTKLSVHGKNTRQQNKLHIPSVRPSSIQRGVYYSSVKIFNQFPQNIFTFHNNICTFKTLLRDYLVKKSCILMGNFFLLVIIMYTNIHIQLVLLFCNAYSYFELWWVYDVFFVIYLVLTNFM